MVGLERQFRGKSAGLRTQTIVGTLAALILLISKYGFGDVLVPGAVVVDPSRVAAQIVAGIGFLSAGLIITRRGAVRGLTTAASVWETAAIGMAAGAGLPLLAGVVTMLHFVVVLGYTPLGRMISSYTHAEQSYTVTYRDGQGVLRALLTTCTAHAWTVNSMVIVGDRIVPEITAEVVPLVSVTLGLAGPRIQTAAQALGSIAGVVRIDRGEDDDE